MLGTIPHWLAGTRNRLTVAGQSAARRLLLETLARRRGNVRATAADLGVASPYLYDCLTRYGLGRSLYRAFLPRLRAGESWREMGVDPADPHWRELGRAI